MQRTDSSPGFLGFDSTGIVSSVFDSVGGANTPRLTSVPCDVWPNTFVESRYAYRMLLYLQTPFSTMVGSSPEGDVHPFLGWGEGPKLHTGGVEVDAAAPVRRDGTRVGRSPHPRPLRAAPPAGGLGEIAPNLGGGAAALLELASPFAARPTACRGGAAAGARH